MRVCAGLRLATWLSSGVMASSLRSRMSSSGGTSVLLKSNSSYSCVMTCYGENERSAEAGIKGQGSGLTMPTLTLSARRRDMSEVSW